MSVSVITFQIIALIITICVLFYILNDTKKRGMKFHWALYCSLGLIVPLGHLGCIISVVCFCIYLIARKPKLAISDQQTDSSNMSINNTQSIKENIVIPDTCPHCKNPNSKKIRLCEWCGNQII